MSLALARARSSGGAKLALRFVVAQHAARHLPLTPAIAPDSRLGTSHDLRSNYFAITSSIMSTNRSDLMRGLCLEW